MKKLLTLLAIVLVIALTFTLCSCTDTIAWGGNVNDASQEAQTEQQMQAASAAVGFPDVTKFSRKKMLKDIYELCDDADLITYAYIKDPGHKYVFIGQCFGYGISDSTQFTNPERIDGYGENRLTVSQPEPDGLWHPESSSATWLMVLDPATGKRTLEYYEPNIIVKQAKLPAKQCEDWSIPEGY